MSDNHHDEGSLDPRILHAAAAGCEQSKLLINRRALLGISASLFTWAYMPRVAEAATGNEPRLLIVVLRGGMDGLHVVPPVGDPDYASARGAMALTAADTLPLGTQPLFRINSRLKTFQSWYGKGQAAIVHSVAPPVQIRSHFECQYNLETGKGDSQIRSGEVGWLNKLLSAMGPGRPVTNPALAVGAAPLILAGPEEVRAWSPGPTPRSQTFNDKLIEIYEEQDPQLARLLKGGLAADQIANPDALGASSSVSLLLQGFTGAGNLLRDINGPRIAVLSIEGWDTHASQFDTLDIRLKELDDSLLAFRTALGEAAWSKTVVACVTEFGRTVRPNGTEGTDHGVGTVALLAGGNIVGRKVHGKPWLGLKPGDLVDQRDVPATTDLRQVFKGIVHDHLGVATTTLDELVFPDSGKVAAMPGLINPFGSV